MSVYFLTRQMMYMVVYLSQVIETKVNRIGKDDLGQMNPEDFQFLNQGKLVKVAQRLHAFAVE
ncbi:MULTISPECIES: hypothetical protein [unclassified Nostoc]|uniref:hypothetical protein n=1 Tax=unclassified Nostoc TaxID=2593658 RepID=UPI002AD28035|nr:hypothetical protein [Nostoc sp. ChiQUE02]